jgi:hypothetical protein
MVNPQYKINNNNNNYNNFLLLLLLLYYIHIFDKYSNKL